MLIFFDGVRPLFSLRRSIIAEKKEDVNGECDPLPTVNDPIRLSWMAYQLQNDYSWNPFFGCCFMFYFFTIFPHCVIFSSSSRFIILFFLLSILVDATNLIFLCIEAQFLSFLTNSLGCCPLRGHCVSDLHTADEQWIYYNT